MLLLFLSLSRVTKFATPIILTLYIVLNCLSRLLYCWPCYRVCQKKACSYSSCRKNKTSGSLASGTHDGKEVKRSIGSLNMRSPSHLARSDLINMGIALCNHLALSKHVDEAVFSASLVSRPYGSPWRKTVWQT